jgi:hypothetical protein
MPIPLRLLVRGPSVGAGPAAYHSLKEGDQYEYMSCVKMYQIIIKEIMNETQHNGC